MDLIRGLIRLPIALAVNTVAVLRVKETGNPGAAVVRAARAVVVTMRPGRVAVVFTWVLPVIVMVAVAVVVRKFYGNTRY